MVDQPARSAAPAGPRASVRHHHGGGHGEVTMQGLLVPPGPLGDHVDRAVGRCALFAVGLIVGIEHEGRRQSRKRGPGRGTAARPQWANPPALRPTPSWPDSRAEPARRRGARPSRPREPGPAPPRPGHCLGSVDHGRARRRSGRWWAQPQQRRCPPPARAACRQDVGPPDPEAGARRSPSPPLPRPAPAGKRRTGTRGDATPRKNEIGPAQRQAAHSASSTTGRRGPQPDQAVSGGARRPRAA